MTAGASSEVAALWRNRWWRAAAVLAVLLVLVTGALGGFRKAGKTRAADMPRHAPGQLLDAGLFTFAPSSGWLTHQPPGRTYASKDETYLVIPVTVTSQARSGYGRTAQDDLVWLQQDAHGQPKPVPADQHMRADDGTFVVNLQPQLPTPLFAIWKLPFATPAPGNIRLGAMHRHFVPRTYLTTESAWIADKPAGIWWIPVQDRRAFAAAAP